MRNLISVNDLSIDEIMSDDEPIEIARELLKWREAISKDVWMLDLLAHTQFATAPQLCRVSHKEDFLEGCKTLKSLIDVNLVSAIKNVKIKHGTHKGRGATVYFLTAKGKRTLKYYLPRTARCARTGFPDKVSHNRINHQLLVAEAYLYYSSICVILRCESEDLLKSDFQTQNNERRRDGLKRLKSGGFPDLKIACIKKGDSSNRIRSVSIEACVNLSSRQIAAKPNEYDWFVLDETVAARIHDVKGDHATIADDILCPLEAEMYFKRGKGGSREKKTKNYAEKINGVLQAIGGGATKRLIESKTGIKETTLRSELEKLVAGKVLIKTETSLVPGVSRGRNQNFYYLAGWHSDRNFIVRQTMRCYAVEKLAKIGFTSFSIDLLFALILTHNETGEEAALLTDFEEFRERDLSAAAAQKMVLCDGERKFRNTYKGNKIIYASYNLSSIRKTIEKYPDTYVLDLCEEREAQSYRLKAELTSGTITRANRQRAD